MLLVEIECGTRASRLDRFWFGMVATGTAR